jgi:hypothetical protein
VLRVVQALAFNMVNTSDPSGASLFRLIHTTRCTVGIDEAERYPFQYCHVSMSHWLRDANYWHTPLTSGMVADWKPVVS